MTNGHERDPIAVGGSLALLAAVAFGVTTPLIKRFGADSGPFVTAALLYAGAALASLLRHTKGEAPIQRRHLPRLLGVALLGAVIAPVCLAWGLHRMSATGASLLLNCEAVFTVLLARAFFEEPIGRRVGLAVALMVAGGALLVTGGRNLVVGAGWGPAAVLLASFGWASDNTLTRPLADLEPTSVVLWKGVIGAALASAMAVLLRERFPRPLDAVALIGCGAVGYGASLRLYLLAQRRIGAARTGSIFAIAPFLGAAVALTMDDRSGDWATLGAGVLMGVAIYLHLTELHGHVHVHDAIEHEHAHRHDDEHHDHRHEAYPIDAHTHSHKHEPRTHLHRHAPDVHHRHRHDRE